MEEVCNIGEEIKKYNMKKYSNNLYLWVWKVRNQKTSQNQTKIDDSLFE